MEILLPMGPVINQKGYPVVLADVGVFPRGSRSIEDKGPEIISGGKGYQAGMGIILPLGGQYGDTSGEEELAYRVFK